MVGIKRIRILKDKLKIWSSGFYDKIMTIGFSLHNFKLKFRNWYYQGLKTNIQKYKS